MDMKLIFRLVEISFNTSSKSISREGAILLNEKWRKIGRIIIIEIHSLMRRITKSVYKFNTY